MSGRRGWEKPSDMSSSGSGAGGGGGNNYNNRDRDRSGGGEKVNRPIVVPEWKLKGVGSEPTNLAATDGSAPRFSQEFWGVS